MAKTENIHRVCKKFNVAPFELLECQAGSGWQIRMQAGTTQKLLALCKKYKPVETGGVLVGLANYKMKVIHVFDVITEPQDSKGTCTGFTRGKKGLPEEIERIKKETGEVIGYIGELLFTPELDYLPKILPGLSAQIRSANLIAQLQAALAGVGIAVLPRFLARDYPQLAPILPEDIMIQRSFYLLMYADGKQLPQVRAVADYVYALAEKERALFLDPP